MKLSIEIYANANNEKFLEISGILSKNGAEVDYERDFAKVIAKTKNQKPDVLLIDSADYSGNGFAMNLFAEDNIFSVPLVIIASGDGAIFGNLPNNYCNKTYESIPQFLQAESENLLKKRLQRELGARDNFACEVREVLQNLGFNASTFGTSYIQDCIVGVMQINCRPRALSKTIYAEVSERNNTSVNNLLRCTRSALESAWRRRHKLQNTKLSCGACFDDFRLCPTVKEFIYYVAYKLSQHLKSHPKNSQTTTSPQNQTLNDDTSSQD